MTRRFLNRSLCWTLASSITLTPLVGFSQEACCFQPAYRLECETVMQPQTVQRYRVEYQTDYVEEEVTSYRPVIKTRTEERQYRVARPVVETNYREERYMVQKPVVETSYRDETYTQTRYVTETSEREEQVTTYKPVVETQYYQQQYAVERPVVETQLQTQQYLVQRPVVETQYQAQAYTTYRPVTTYQNQTVDAGGYVAQSVVTPGAVQYGLQWAPQAYATPGPLGIFARVRGAAVWTPQVTPPTVQTQLAYRPNYITQQVAQTAYVPEVQQVQVPVQVQRVQTEVVNQQVPVQVTRMQTETVTQNVPVQTTRMVPTTEVRKIPVVVQRPVTETLTRRVPVQEQKWVTEEQVRKVPVQTTRMVYETKSESVPVQYTEYEKVVQVVRKPVTRRVYVPYTSTVMVPTQVVQRAPLAYYDPFSPAIVNGFSSFGSSIPATNLAPADAGPSVLTQPSSDPDAAESRLQKVEIDPAESSPSDKQSASEGAGDAAGKSGEAPSSLDAPQNSGSGSIFEQNESNLNGADPADEAELPLPELPATEAGWKIYWMPSLAKEV